MKRAIIIAAMLAAAGLAGAQMFAQLFGTSSRLPAGYRECNWIATSGTQYINTGVAASNVVGYLVAYSPMSFSGSAAILGTTGNRHVFQNATRINVYVGTTYKDVYFTSGDTLTFLLSGLVLSFNGTPVTTYASGPTGGGSFLIGSSGGSNTVRWMSVFLELSNGQTRNYVPCLNPSNVPGVYDLVTQTFYDNDGTGNFTYDLK